MIIISDVGWASLVAATALGLFAWLIRSLTLHSLNKNLELNKAQLEATNAREIERFRHDLKVAAFEHELIQADLVKRRADVVEALFSRTIDYLAAAEGFARKYEYPGESSKEKKLKVLQDATRDFWIYFYRHRIFLPGPLCDSIEAMHREVFQATREYNFWRAVAQQTGKSQDKEFDAWDQAEKVVTERVPKVLREIEDEFRDILGVRRGD